MFYQEQEINGFLVYQSDKVHAYKNSCPHTGVALNWQPDVFLDTDCRLIQCATHGAKFMIESGQCIHGPCVGAHLTPLNIELIDELVFLKMD